MRAGIFVIALLWSTVAGAQQPIPKPTAARTSSTTPAADDEDPVRLLTTASNAFEYRDFKKVIDVLASWVHPPRIADPDQLREARRLLGISLHIEGDVPAAREEFSQVLLAEPDIELDPFVVPPAVIETFEAVRRQMGAVLDRRRTTEQPPTQPGARSAAASRVAVLAPLGLGQIFDLDQPVWGGTLLGLQVAGIATWIAGAIVFDGAKDASNQVPTENLDQKRLGQTLWVVGTVVGVGAYGVGVVQGQLEISARLRSEAARRTEGAQANAPRALPGLTRHASFRVRF